MPINFELDLERAPRCIQAVREKYNYHPPSSPQEIEARPPIPFVPMTPERKAELLEALARRMPRSHYEDAVS